MADRGACPTLSTVTPDKGRVVPSSKGVVKPARMRANEKNNKPHENRRNQEQYKKGTSSVNALQFHAYCNFFFIILQADKVFITTSHFMCCSLHSYGIRVR